MTAIRTAVVGDEELLAKLNGFVQDLPLARRPDQFKATEPAELSSWFRSVLERLTTRMWIAEEQGTPVGYVLAILDHRPETPFSLAQGWRGIDQLAVDPAHRRQGSRDAGA